MTATPQPPVIAHFDGLCEPTNPGGAACGGWHVLPCAAVRGLAHGLRGGRFYLAGPGATSNVAEYRAALDALDAISRTGYRGAVVLRGDAQLIVRQFTGQYSCHAAHLRPLLDHLRAAAGRFEHVTLEWVPRASNGVADAQSRSAYRAWRAGGRAA